MKRRTATIRPAGVLCWSTACLIAGLGLSGCERQSTYTATAKDEEMAKTQKNVEQLDKLRTTLTGGEVPNNFHLEGVGYYHAGAHDFFPEAFGTARDGKYFVNGMWQANPPPVEEIPPSRPTPDALKKVLAALEKEQKEEQQTAGTGGTVHHHHHRSGFGVTEGLLMYWMLSGNRNSFTPTPGFHSAAAQAPAWQSQIDRDRENVRSYASSNPGYRRAVEESKASGGTVRSGQTVRGGFGGSSSSKASNSSSGSRSSGS